MRAMITGGRGFVGGWLAEHLRDEGDEVTLVDRETDVADPATFDGVLAKAAPDVVYHLAALTHVGASWESPQEVLRVNVLGTASVLEAARAHGCAGTLVVSSSEVYGHVQAGQLPVDETAPVAPVTPYAASKAAAEQVALQTVRGHGQRVVVARPFNHVGPRQPPSFAVSALARRIVEACRQGKAEVPVGTITTRRDFTDVRDVVRAYRLLMLHGLAGEVYNVGSGQDVAIRDIAERLLALSGAQLGLRADPELVRPVDVPVIKGSPTKLQELTGWKPAIALDDTLADVLRYWQDQPA
jgi:GDP-4-dehydro-6-deoxy-D-mannose reductase